MEKIVFVDSIREANAFIQNSKKENSYIVIALSPSTYVYLRKHGYNPNDTQRYFTNESHKRILEKSKEATEWLRENAEFVNLGTGLSKVLFTPFIFYVRFIMHYFFCVSEVILNAIKLHVPNTLLASCAPRDTASIHVDSEEEYLGTLTERIAKVTGLNFEYTKKTGMRRDKLRLSPLYSFKLVAKYIDFRMWEALHSDKETGPIVFTTKHYSMKKLSEEIKKDIPDRRQEFLKGPVSFLAGVPYFVTANIWKKHSKLIYEQKALFEKLERKMRSENKVFSYRDIVLVDMVIEKFRRSLYDYIIGEMLWSIDLDRFIKHTKPACFISNGNRLDESAIAESGRNKGIPSILISHGSMVRPKNDYEKIEWGEQGTTLLRAPFSSVALQSPLADEYLKTFSQETKKVITGPLAWGNKINPERSRHTLKMMFKNENLSENSRIIIHAGTPKSNKDCRPYVYETSYEYISSICNLAHAVEKIPEAYLIVRFRTTKEISLEDLKELVPFSNKVILSVKESFMDVLGMADLLVSFSSTTIEEALQNEIPVLLYGGSGRYEHIPAFEIKKDKSTEKKAIYHVKKNQDLEYALREILGQTPCIKNNSNLFRPYIYEEHIRTKFTDFLKKEVF